VQKRKTQTQTKIFDVTRVRLFSSSAQVWFYNVAVKVLKYNEKCCNEAAVSYAAFTHAGLTTRYLANSCMKVFLCCQVTQYIVYEEDRRPSEYCRNEIWVL